MKVAVLSFAHTHATSYIVALRDRDDIELLTSDPDRDARPEHETGGRSFADDLGVAYVDTWEEVAAWQPDAVIVCSENARHRTDTERAAAIGAHVLCEKPIATSLADAEAMINACDAAGVQLMIAYPVRYSPTFTAVLEAHRAGRLGTLRGLHGANNGKIPAGQRAWFVDPAWAGGGALIDHVVHLADLYDELLDHVPAESVYASTNTLLPGADTGVETAAQVSIRYPGGVIASIDASWLVPQGSHLWGGLTMEAFGDRGMAAMDAFGQRVDGYSAVTGGPLGLTYGPDLDAIMLATFLDVVRNGTPPPVDGRGGYRSLAVALAALESARTGKAVDLAPLPW
ncbi:Gfo/Idh/MocA family protein [Propionibacteriaceae bacterium Y2011]